MQVLDFKDQRPTLTALQAHLFQRVEGVGLDGFRRQPGEAFCAVLYSQQLEQIRRSVLGL